MNRKKLTSLMLLMLIAVNIFLAVNIGIMYISSYRSEKENLKNAISLVPQELSFSEDAFSRLPSYLYSYTAVRDPAKEQKAAVSLLGKDAVSTENGEETVYSQEDLYVSFRKDGTADGLIYYDEGDAGEFLGDIFKGRHISLSYENNFLSCKYDGYRVFNAGLSVFSQDGKVIFSGTLPVNSDFSRDSVSRSRGEMVLAIADYINLYGFGALKSVSAVYAVVPEGQNIRLVPCVRAECDGGILVISSLDKTLLYFGD